MPTPSYPPQTAASTGRGFDSLLDHALFLTGPTASGKSAVAVELCRRIGGGVYSVDSMAVYREMDIGTAKPTPQQREMVPHHLIDIVDPAEEFSVGQYLEAAHRAARASAAPRPLFAGGTPLYLNGLIRGMYVGPPADPEFRAAVEDDAEQHGLQSLRDRLWQVDPLSAHKLHPNDRRRIIRALEVAYLTGHPLSHHQLQFDRRTGAEDCLVFGLRMPRETLHARVDARVEQMFANGFVEEVRGLTERPGGIGKTARQAVGYREVLQHLSGELGLADAIEATKVSTHRLVRKQETWFRNMPELTPIEVEPGASPGELADTILRICRQRNFQFECRT